MTLSFSLPRHTHAKVEPLARLHLYSWRGDRLEHSLPVVCHRKTRVQAQEDAAAAPVAAPHYE